MSKHTKGRWETIGETGVVCKGHGFIAIMPHVAMWPGHEKTYIRRLEEREANMNLIASVPEMLKELDGLQAEIEELNKQLVIKDEYIASLRKELKR